LKFLEKKMHDCGVIIALYRFILSFLISPKRNTP